MFITSRERAPRPIRNAALALGYAEEKGKQMGTPAIVAVGNAHHWRGCPVRTSGAPANLGVQLLLRIKRNGVPALADMISTVPYGWSMFPAVPLDSGLALSQASDLGDYMWLYILDVAASTLIIRGIVSGEHWVLHLDENGDLLSERPHWMPPPLATRLPTSTPSPLPQALFRGGLFPLGAADVEAPRWVDYTRHVVEGLLLGRDKEWSVPARKDATCVFRLRFNSARLELPDRPELTAGVLGAVNGLGETRLLDVNLMRLWSAASISPPEPSRVEEYALALARLATDVSALHVEPTLSANKRAVVFSERGAGRKSPSGPPRYRNDANVLWTNRVVEWFGEPVLG